MIGRLALVFFCWSASIAFCSGIATGGSPPEDSAIYPPRPAQSPELITDQMPYEVAVKEVHKESADAVPYYIVAFNQYMDRRSYPAFKTTLTALKKQLDAKGPRDGSIDGYVPEYSTVRRVACETGEYAVRMRNNHLRTQQAVAAIEGMYEQVMLDKPFVLAHVFTGIMGIWPIYADTNLRVAQNGSIEQKRWVCVREKMSAYFERELRPELVRFIGGKEADLLAEISTAECSGATEKASALRKQVFEAESKFAEYLINGWNRELRKVQVECCGSVK